MLEVRVPPRHGVAVEHDVVVGAAADARRVVLQHEPLAEQRGLLRVDHDQAVGRVLAAAARWGLDHLRYTSLFVEVTHARSAQPVVRPSLDIVRALPETEPTRAWLFGRDATVRYALARPTSKRTDMPRLPSRRPSGQSRLQCFLRLPDPTTAYVALCARSRMLRLLRPLRPSTFSACSPHAVRPSPPFAAAHAAAAPPVLADAPCGALCAAIAC